MINWTQAFHIKLNKLNHIFINLSPLLALPHLHLPTRLTPSTDTSVRWPLLTYFHLKHLPILPLLPVSNGFWMYVIIPCTSITGASKPNELLYQNDRLHLLPPNGMRKGFEAKPFLKYHCTNSSRITPEIQKTYHTNNTYTY